MRLLRVFLVLMFALISALEAAHADSTNYYDDLFADGRFDITLALGFEQNESLPILRDQINTQGDIDDIDDSIVGCQECHFTMTSQRPGERIYSAVFDYKGHSIQARLRFIYSEKNVAMKWLKGAFIEALGHDDLIMYVGHSRDGSGFPDFATPVAETGKVFRKDTYRGWLGFDEGYFAPKKYQILSVNSCKSFQYYRTPLREKVWEKDPSKLALILTGEDTVFKDNGPTSVALIRALMYQFPSDVIAQEIETAAEVFHRDQTMRGKVLFKFDGFFDSTYRSTSRPKRPAVKEPWRDIPF